MPAGEPAHPGDGVDRRLTRDHGQRQQVGDHGELRHHRLFPADDLARQPPVPAEHAGREADQGGSGRQRRVDRAGQPGVGGHAHPAREQPKDPAHQLLQPELVHGRRPAESAEPPAHRRRTTNQPVHHGDRVLQQRPEQAPRDEERCSRGRREDQQAGRCGRVGQIRRQAVLQPDGAHGWSGPDGDDDTGRGDEPEQPTDRGAVHRALTAGPGLPPEVGRSAA